MNVVLTSVSPSPYAEKFAVFFIFFFPDSVSVIRNSMLPVAVSPDVLCRVAVTVMFPPCCAVVDEPSIAVIEMSLTGSPTVISLPSTVIYTLSASATRIQSKNSPVRVSFDTG